MNFTALFISRPVMTTLVMLGILIFGIAAFFAPSRKRFAKRGFPDDTGFRLAPRGKPGDNGLGGGNASRKAILYDCRHRFNDINKRAWKHTNNHSVQLKPQY